MKNTRRIKRMSRNRVTVTTGLIASYEQSEINREFLYLQTRFYGARFSLYATQEVDFNRDWKADAGEDAVSLTSTYLNLDLRATSWLSPRTDRSEVMFSP